MPENTINTPKKNILITSASAKAPLILDAKKALAKIFPDGLVIAADMDEKSLCRYVADNFWLMPKTSLENREKILKYCNENDVFCILPTRDGELEFWSENSSFFEKFGITVVVSSTTTVQKCIDKLKFYEASKKEYSYVIPTFASIHNCRAERYVVKERFGAGSKSAGIKLDKKDAINHASQLSEPIFQPYIEGTEVSVDAWANRHHEIMGLVLRRRELIQSGESKITTTFKNSAIETQILKFLNDYKFCGPIVLQAFLTDDKKLQIIECNARFGGASTASIRVGLDLLYWTFAEAAGIKLPKSLFKRKEQEITQIRIPYDMERVVDEANNI